MKKLLIAASLALVAALALPTAAAADELPRIYLGQWCGDRPAQNRQETYENRRTDVRNLVGGGDCGDDKVLVLKRDGFTYGDDSCRFTSIRKTGESWPRWTKPTKGDWPKGDWVPEVDVVAKCASGTVKLRFNWIKGDVLRVTGDAFVAELTGEMPDQLRGTWCYVDYRASDHSMIYARRRCGNPYGDDEQIMIGRYILSDVYKKRCGISTVRRNKENSWQVEFQCPQNESAWSGMMRVDLALEQGRLYWRYSDR
jgi:hypothetical protein